MDDTTLLPLASTARRLGLPVSWLRAEVLAGRLPCLRVGRRIFFNPAAVRAALAERASVQQGGADAD